MALRRKKNKSNLSRGPSPHDRYSLRCYCGKQLSGNRDVSSQTVTCPECGEPNYVMGQDVYPRPAILETPEHKDSSNDRTTVVEPTELQVTEIPDDERLAEPVNDTPPRVWIDEPKGARVQKRIFQIAGAVSLLLLLTFWGLSSRKSRGVYEEQFLKESTAAWDYVLSNEWEKARHSAGLSVDAADHLNRDDDASVALRHLSRELEIIDQLSSYSVIEIVLDQPALKEESASGHWEELFRARYGSRWLLLQGTIVRQRGEDEEMTYSLETAIDLPDQQVDLVWDVPVAWFEDLKWTKNHCEVFLAVELMNARPRGKSDQHWEMVLSSENAKLWRNPVLLEEVYGFPISAQSEDPFVQLVLSQSLQPEGLLKSEEEAD